MTEFIETALSFPAVVFSFMLLVVVLYWLVALLGGLGLDILDGDTDAAGFTGFFSATGLGGVPVTVSVSLLIALAWFGSLTGTVILDQFDLPAPAAIALGVVVIALAVVAAWVLTSFVVMLVRRTLPQVRESSNSDFVGRLCVIRTVPIGDGLGQAEVTADDGSSAIIHVRQTGQDEFSAGGTALIFDYDATDRVFWVSPFAAELDPGGRET